MDCKMENWTRVRGIYEKAAIQKGCTAAEWLANFSYRFAWHLGQNAALLFHAFGCGQPTNLRFYFHLSFL
jgi:hypothetical protein